MISLLILIISITLTGIPWVPGGSIPKADAATVNVSVSPSTFVPVYGGKTTIGWNYQDRPHPTSLEICSVRFNPPTPPPSPAPTPKPGAPVFEPPTPYTRTSLKSISSVGSGQASFAWNGLSSGGQAIEEGSHTVCVVPDDAPQYFNFYQGLSIANPAPPAPAHMQVLPNLYSSQHIVRGIAERGTKVTLEIYYQRRVGYEQVTSDVPVTYEVIIPFDESGKNDGSHLTWAKGFNYSSYFDSQFPISSDNQPAKYVREWQLPVELNKYEIANMTAKVERLGSNPYFNSKDSDNKSPDSEMVRVLRYTAPDWNVNWEALAGYYYRATDVVMMAEKAQLIASDNGIPGQTCSDGNRCAGLIDKGWNLILQDRNRDLQLAGNILPEELEDLTAEKIANREHFPKPSWWDPINMATGDFDFKHTNLSLQAAFPIEFGLSYHSRDTYDGAVGVGWRHSWEWRLERRDKGIIHVTSPDGGVYPYEPRSDGGFIAPLGTYNSLEKLSNGMYQMETPESWVYLFREDGKLVEIRDANKSSVYLRYYGSVLKSIETKGALLTLSYGSGGKISTVSDHSGREVKYRYNELTHDLTSMELADGATISFTYDSNHRMLTITNPEKTSTLVNVYDGQGRVVEQTDFNGRKGTIEYDPANGKTIATDPLGNKKTFYYDSRLRQTGIDYADGTFERFVFDSNDNRTLWTDRNGAQWKYGYDPEGNMTLVTDPLGYSVKMTYNERRQPLTITDSRGYVSEFNYDSHGNLSSTKNALGEKTQFIYNSEGVVTDIINAEGEKSSFTLDEYGFVSVLTDAGNFGQTILRDGLHRVVEQMDSLNLKKKFEYDPRDRIKKIIDELGNTTTYSYDKDSNLVEYEDASGAKTTMTYEFDKVNSIKDALGNIREFDYDALGHLQSVTEPNGLISTYQNDSNGRVTKEWNKDSQTGVTYATEYRYDGNGNLVWQKEPNGGISEFRYDGRNLPVWMKDSVGAQSELFYDGNGNLVQAINDKGHSTFYSYDELNRVAAITSADGNKTTYAYDKAGRVITVNEPGGAKWQSDYDPRGLLVKSTDPNGNTESFTRNSAGFVTVYKDSLQAELAFTYDGLGRVLTKTDPKGGVERFSYDAAGRVETYTDANKNKTQYEYDLLGRLVHVRNALGEVTSYRYDTIGNLIETKTAGGAVTTWSYDAFGRLTKKINAENEKRTYAYDSSGLMSESVDALGKRTTYAYDLQGRITEKRMPNGEVFAYSYDSIGQLIHASTSTNEQSFTYDAMGRISTMQNNTWDKSVRFKYDERGNRTHMTDPEGNTQEYVYDLLNQIKEFTDPDGFKTTFEYDARGAMTKVNRPNGIQSTYAYNDNLQLVSLDHKGERTQSRLEYAYDLAGNITQKAEEDGAKTEYAYDGLNRIQHVQYPQAKDAEILDIYDLPFKQQDRKGSTHSYRDTMVKPPGEVAYTYDSDGNRKTMSADGKTTAYEYDKAGRMVRSGEETFVYDANGNRVQERGNKGLIRYSYDSNDMLEQVLYDDGSKVEYDYDAFLQKIGRKESYPDPRQQPTLLESERATQSTYGESAAFVDNLQEEPVLIEDQTYYLNDGLTIMKEYGEDLEPIAQYYEANGDVLSRKSYRNTLWNVMDDEAPIRKSEAPVRGMLRGDFTYYLNDHLGSVTHLTDRNGETLEQYRYDAFGSLMTPMTPEYNTIGYTGQTIDPKTGLMDYKARWYDSGAGQFTSADTFEGNAFNPLSLNLYTYVINNPLKYVDPTGNQYIIEGATWEEGSTIFKTGANVVVEIANFLVVDDIRTIMNPKSSYFDKGLAIVGLLPVGKIIKGGKIIVKFADKSGKHIERAVEATAKNQAKAHELKLLDDEAFNKGKPTKSGNANKALNQCNCFIAGTKVLTDEGEKPIEEIEVGDKVLAKSEYDSNGELAYKEVTALYRNQRDDIIKLYVGEQVIETTDNHPFWVEGKGWVYADELQVGDKLQKADRSNLTIDKVEFVKLEEPVTVYNFTVADFHTYYVTDLGIWVHNTQCGYKDITVGKSVKNVSTNVTKADFESSLLGDGWTKTVAKDGSATIYSKDGAKYVVRDKSNQGQQTADYYAKGSKAPTTKIRLGSDE